MAYQFRLEQVRHLREQERQQAQWKYFEALQRLQGAEAKLSEALAREREAEYMRDASDGNPLSAQSIQDFQNYLNVMRQVTKQRQLMRDKLQKQVQTEQMHLRERRVSEQIMNKLRQTDYMNYCLEEKRRDQGLMDEIAVTRYGRNTSGGGGT